MSHLPTILFYAVAILTGLSAIMVVVSQNIVRAAAWLLFALGGVAAIFFFLGADFVGATQLIVYVGGTLVLVVFGVMLTAQGPFITMRTSAVEWALSLIVGLLLLGTLIITTWTGSFPDKTKGENAAPEEAMVNSNNPATSNNTIQIGHSLLGQPIGPRNTGYLLPFEIISVHLLVVLIGAAYLARSKRRRGATNAIR
jgi:NADH:ubiquinone oxidoreductase subunit 6 (subunit J)